MAKFNDASLLIERVGLQRHWAQDLYQRFLELSWITLLGLVFVTYLCVNAFFALLYLAVGGGIENAKPGDFLDVFFFSVQTMATVGYGKMAPVTVAANSLATVEALMGLIGFAMVTGLMFAKFARPTAAVMFSQHLLLTQFEGRPTLQFRVANERRSQIVEAQMRFVMLRSGVTAEGQTVRRMSDLGLTRSQNAFFALTWLAIHPIDEKSPFFGLHPDDIKKEDIQFVASLTGIEEISGQTVHSRHWYSVADVRVDHKFVDIINRGPGGRGKIDYGKFHDVEIAPVAVAIPLGSGPAMARKAGEGTRLTA